MKFYVVTDWCGLIPVQLFISSSRGLEPEWQLQIYLLHASLGHMGNAMGTDTTKTFESEGEGGRRRSFIGQTTRWIHKSCASSKATRRERLKKYVPGCFRFHLQKNIGMKPAFYKNSDFRGANIYYCIVAVILHIETEYHFWPLQKHNNVCNQHVWYSYCLVLYFEIYGEKSVLKVFWPCEEFFNL